MTGHIDLSGLRAASFRNATRVGGGSARSSYGVRAATVLSEDELRQHVPSVFAQSPHESRSRRYGYIPTIDMVRGLEGEGFAPVFACEAKARDQDRKGFTKHLVRFRRGDTNAVRNALGSVGEVVLINSHDGSSSYHLLGGVFRFICANGMVTGDGYQEVRVAHRAGKNLVHDVIEGAFSVVGDIDRALTCGETMKRTAVTRETSLALAESALALRYHDAASDRVEAPIAAERLLIPRRHEDTSRDLWTTFNVVQENLIRGGVEGVRTGADGRRRRHTTRPVNGIDQNTALNRALWTLGERMAQLLAPQTA